MFFSTGFIIYCRFTVDFLIFQKSDTGQARVLAFLDDFIVDLLLIFADQAIRNLTEVVSNMG